MLMERRSRGFDDCARQVKGCGCQVSIHDHLSDDPPLWRATAVGPRVRTGRILDSRQEADRTLSREHALISRPIVVPVHDRKPTEQLSPRGALLSILLLSLAGWTIIALALRLL